MAFTVKDWQDAPSVATPITAAALEDMEQRLSAYTDAAAPAAGSSSVLYTLPGQPAPDPSAYPDGTLWIELLG